MKFLAYMFTVFLLSVVYSAKADASSTPVKVKVFIAAMFEIGSNSGDKAGEFQFWYEQYFTENQALLVRGAANPVFCNTDGVCGAVLGMGKVASSASMQAIILNQQFDFSQAYFLLSGVAGTPPSRGTIGDVSWGTWLVDYDLGHRWRPEEGKQGDPVFMPRKGYEDIRKYQLNPKLTAWCISLTQGIKLEDSNEAIQYRMRYKEKAARRSPRVLSGTHMTGDTFFHGPGLSKEAQYIAKLYGADDYVSTEMEAAAIVQVINRTFGTKRVMSLRGSVNFDQGNPNETTLEHLDPAPGQTAGGFSQTVANIALVGKTVVDHIILHWDDWKESIPQQ